MSVVAASGFRAAGVAAGIKPSGALDMSLLVADEAVPTAAIFTTSLTAAPPVLLSREHVARGQIRAVVVNSGGANAGTGAAGMEDARTMAATVAESIGCESQEVVVCSTGAIGGRLPLDRIRAGVGRLVAGLGVDDAHAEAAARGIMTTDSVTKQACVRGDGWTVGGMAKGAGMLRPDMATMLAFLTTDADVGADTLRGVLRAAADVSFNVLDVDGCQSTNDTVVLMASGRSGIDPGPRFAEAVEEVCRALALQMARDAEGASKVVTIRVHGAVDDDAARRLALEVADSALVRSSFYGADPNWGRIVQALGVAGAPVEPDAISVAYDGTVICRDGTRVDVDEDELSSRLKGDFVVDIGVGHGPGRVEVTTTDLTPQYVIFNGERS